MPNALPLHVASRITKNVFTALAMLAATVTGWSQHAAALDSYFGSGRLYSAQYDEPAVYVSNPDGSNYVTFNMFPTYDSVSGLAFSPDGKLYATTNTDFDSTVRAFGPQGQVLESYPVPGYLMGNISYGKVAVDQQHLYVAGGNSLFKFNRGDSDSAVGIYSNNQVFDVEILPSGNLLVASAYEIEEITSTGTVVRTIDMVGPGFTDIRGIEYDPDTNNLFVTHLGHTGFFHRLMRLDATTGVLEESISFNYADDLFLLDSGDLLVGSRTNAPRIYSQDLDLLDTLAGGERIFVTQYVPEPSSVVLVFGLLPCLAYSLHRRRKSRRA